MTARLVLAFAAVALCARVAGAQPAPVLTKPPALVTFVEAVYPADEQAAGRSASVVLQLDLDATGHVTDATVVTSAGDAFDAAAVVAARQFVFTPAELDGVPAAIRLLYQYDFVLRTEVEIPTTADFTGVVRDPATGAPLAGITVDLGDGAVAVTGADGRFALARLAPGARTVLLSGPSITPLSTQEELIAGQALDVIYEVVVAAPDAPVDDDGDDLEIVVTAPPLARAAASTAVVAGDARTLPGTGGDVLKVVESMPGVARPAVGSSALVVWGAAPEDTRVYVAGVRVPQLYHQGGLRSVIAADMVGGIELVPGGYGAAYGRGLGGLVRVELAPLDGDGVSGSAAIDLLDAGAAVRVPIGKWRLAAAARKSGLGWLLDHATDDDPSALFPVPRYADAQARAVYQRSTREAFELGALGSTDHTRRAVASVDPAATETSDRVVRFWRAWTRSHRELDDGAAVELLAYAGGDVTSRIDRFGGVPTELEDDARVYGARATWRGALRDGVVATVGLDAELSDARVRRRGSVTSPAREGDVGVFGQPPPDQLVEDRWHVVTASAAPFAEVDLALARGRIHLVPGLRLDPQVVSVSRRTPVAGATPAIGLFREDTSVEPRLAIVVDATSRLTIRGAFGRYRQAPTAEDLSAVFGNPALPPSTGAHYVVGGAYRWSGGVTSELTGFVTTSSDLAVRSASATPLLAAALEPEGTGRVIGAQALVRQELRHGVRGWISYSVSRSTRTDHPGVAARAFDYDQTHVLTAVASWLPGAGFEVGVRVRYATGAPRTEVVDAYYDARHDRYQPVFGEHNAIRLPAFVQVDARIARTFHVGGDALEVYLDLQNATARDNAEELVYSADFATRGIVRGLPILPLLGARMTW